MTESRRSFLIRSGAVATAFGTRGLASESRTALAAAADPASFPQPCAPSAWQKKGIILEPDEPWEDDHIESFMSTVDRQDGGRWRIWYAANSPTKGYIGIAFAEGVPGEKMTKTRAVLSEGEPEDAPLAIGNVPKNWRLACPNYLRLKNGKHRLYFFADGRIGRKAVQRYLAADSDDGRRFRVIDPERPCLYTVWDTTTGKKFWPGQTLDDIQTNDGACVYQLPDGTFEMYAQALEPIDEKDPRYVAHDNIKNSARHIDRLTSEDGIRFTHRDRKVLVPDKNDPIDTQFYELTVTHTPQGRVGIVGWYRVRAGTMELQYVHSNDGVTWNRIRQPWIERGKPGEPDSATIYPPASMAYHDHKWWLFYTGVNYTHSTVETTKPNEKARSVIMLATTPSLFA